MKNSACNDVFIAETYQKHGKSIAIIFIYHVNLNIHFTCIGRDLYSDLLSIFTEVLSYIAF